ncbi:peptidylprolyl isomerase [Candidatus Woesearchaeota archaeon]|nr:peptidylprolyl isomerase [Candidatus Woesearchaeota archaeon]
MPVIKKHDFVEIEYTARVKEDNSIFDTTNDHSPVVICVGEHSILQPVEERMIGKETGKDYTFEIDSMSAFGKRDAKLIQLIPAGKFRQQNIQPFPGLQLNIDGVFGVVKTVSGGRVLVDFNHPLAGKDVIYNVKIHRLVEDQNEKLASLVKTHLGVKDAEIGMKDGVTEIKCKSNVPKQLQDEFGKVIERVIPSIKSIKIFK